MCDDVAQDEESKGSIVAEQRKVGHVFGKVVVGEGHAVVRNEPRARLLSSFARQAALALRLASRADCSRIRASVMAKDDGRWDDDRVLCLLVDGRSPLEVAGLEKTASVLLFRHCRRLLPDCGPVLLQFLSAVGT